MRRIVEDECAIDHAHRGVQRAQGGRPLDVHVDVAGGDQLDPVGVATEFARSEDVDSQADVGGGNLVGDDLGATRVLRLLVLVAVREGQLDFGLRRADGEARQTPEPRVRRSLAVTSCAAVTTRGDPEDGYDEDRQHPMPGAHGHSLRVCVTALSRPQA